MLKRFVDRINADVTGTIKAAFHGTRSYVNDDFDNNQKVISMTDGVDLVGQGDVGGAEAPQQTITQTEEKLVPQSQVANALKHERERAYEKGKKEAQEEARRLMQSQQQGSGGSQANDADMRRVIAEEARQLMAQERQKAQMEQVVGSFVNKIDSAVEKHPELKKKLADVDFETLAPIVALATDLDNTADIMAHLVDDPMKTANLLTLLDKQPGLAVKAVYELSNSLKQNENAQKMNDRANEPFGSPQRTGQSGMADESNYSVTDFRKIFR